MQKANNFGNIANQNLLNISILLEIEMRYAELALGLNNLISLEGLGLKNIFLIAARNAILNNPNEFIDSSKQKNKECTDTLIAHLRGLTTTDIQTAEANLAKLIIHKETTLVEYGIYWTMLQVYTLGKGREDTHTGKAAIDVELSLSLKISIAPSNGHTSAGHSLKAVPFDPNRKDDSDIPPTSTLKLSSSVMTTPSIRRLPNPAVATSTPTRTASNSVAVTPNKVAIPVVAPLVVTNPKVSTPVVTPIKTAPLVAATPVKSITVNIDSSDIDDAFDHLHNDSVDAKLSNDNPMLFSGSITNCDPKHATEAQKILLANSVAAGTMTAGTTTSNGTKPPVLPPPTAPTYVPDDRDSLIASLQLQLSFANEEILQLRKELAMARSQNMGGGQSMIHGVNAAYNTAAMQRQYNPVTASHSAASSLHSSAASSSNSVATSTQSMTFSTSTDTGRSRSRTRTTPNRTRSKSRPHSKSNH